MLQKIPQNIIISFLFLVFGGVLLWLSELTLIFEMSGFTSFVPSLFAIQPFISKSIVLVLLGAIGFVVNRINQKHRFVEGNSNSFLLFCVLGFVASFLPMGSLFSGIASLLSAVSLAIVLQVYNQKSVLGLLFLSAILTGIATLFFYPAIAMVLILLLTIAFFRPFEIRNYMVIAVGLILPWFYFLCAVYLVEVTWSWPDFKFGGLINELLVWQYWVPVVLFLMISIVAALKVFANRSKFIVRQRNQFLIISIYLIIHLLIGVFFQDYFSLAGIVAFLAIFIQYYYKKIARKWVIDLFALLLLSAIIWLKF